MADEDDVEEAFRTATGMARAVLRKDLEGLEELWYGSEEPDKVAFWIATVAAVGAEQNAHLRGITVDEWFAEQVAIFGRRGGSRGPDS